MAKGYSGKSIPKKAGFTGKKEKSNLELYMEQGHPCGDVGSGQPAKERQHNSGVGNIVGGYEEGIHHGFANGIPNAGRENISAEYMKPVHNSNVKESVFDNIGMDSHEWSAHGSKITPEDMGVHHTFGVS